MKSYFNSSIDEYVYILVLDNYLSNTSQLSELYVAHL